MSELPPSLSAAHPNTFAYDTVNKRMPVILTKCVDALYKLKTAALGQTGGSDDLKTVTGLIANLRYDLETDKPLKQLADSADDVAIWNSLISCLPAEPTPSWYNTSWLFVECYMYRRIREAVELSSQHKNIDVFAVTKNEALESSKTAVEVLLTHLHNHLEGRKLTGDELGVAVSEFVQLSLWGNKCDLSLRPDGGATQLQDPVAQVEDLHPRIIVDNLREFVCWLKVLQPGRRFDIVFDNAGFELISDLCLADVLISSGLAAEVVLHPKNFPWFVSDTTPQDLDHTLQWLEQQIHPLPVVAAQWRKYLSSGQWRLSPHLFWTLPCSYPCMKEMAPELHADLQCSDLVIFKGDLNGRKLLSDLSWSPTEKFECALLGFRPSNLLLLRTLKSDCVAGVAAEVAVATAKLDEKWMVDGEFGTIHFVCK